MPPTESTPSHLPLHALQSLQSLQSYSSGAQTQQLNSNTKIVIESIIIIVTSHLTPFSSLPLDQSINPPPSNRSNHTKRHKKKSNTIPQALKKQTSEREEGRKKKLKFVSVFARRPPSRPSEQEGKIAGVYTINPAKTTLSPPTTAATKPGVRPRSRGSLSTCGKRIDAAEEVILFSSRSPCDDDEEEDEDGEASTSEDVKSARNASDKIPKMKVLRKRWWGAMGDMATRLLIGG